MTQTQFQERHQDYVINLGTLAPGALQQAIDFRFDPDAPFVLRGYAVRCQYDANRIQTGLGKLAIRFTGPNLDYRQQALIPCGVSMVYFGQFGCPKPVSREILYPAAGQFRFDAQNNGAVTLTNVQIILRGVKLYPWGASKDYTYPEKMAAKPWTYSGLTNNCVATNVPVTTTGPGPQYIFRPDPDSDFVFRGLSWGPVNQNIGTTAIVAPQPYEIFLTLQDEDNKPYSNAPVHFDVLMANPLTGPTFEVGGGNTLAPFGTGAQVPGLFFPEIYVPKQHILYYNVTRNDGSFADQVQCDIPLQFMGMKVYKR